MKAQSQNASTRNIDRFGTLATVVGSSGLFVAGENVNYPLGWVIVLIMTVAILGALYISADRLTSNQVIARLVTWFILGCTISVSVFMYLLITMDPWML